jgi:hypothetical protein
MPETKQTLDYSALSRKVTFGEVRKQKEFWYIAPSTIIGLVSVAVCVGIFFSNGFSSAFAIGGFGIVMLVFSLAFYQSISDKIRMTEFARANDMTYTANLDYDNRPGVLYNEGHSKHFSDILTSTKLAFCEMGTYEYITGSGKNQTTHTFGFVKIKLPRKLPNMVLDSKKNNFMGKFSNLPTGLSGNQKLSLEGDFDSYFTLYTPKEYATDALYVFTPDVMQAIIDAAQDYDCEVIDDNFYLYSSYPINIKDAKQIQEMLGITSKLRSELASQTDYYADERVGNRALNTISTEGVRLKHHISSAQIIAIIISIVIFLIAFLLPFIMSFYN